ncbi:MAG: hypothetical protein WB772_02330 [Xanthobacteraceae bacterium]
MQAASQRNVRFVGHSDQGGRSDGVQVMVHRGHAYVGHIFSGGFSVVDVRDPKKPQAVAFVPTPENTWALHLQVHDDLLLVVNAANVWTAQKVASDKEFFSRPLTESFDRHGMSFAAGLRVYDISQPARPREIAFMPVNGLGPHRIWYVGGRYAYISAHFEGFTDRILAIVDMSDPTKPHIVGRWWLPGMWQAGGETPQWPQGRRYALHHAVVAGTTAYGAWLDGGLTVLDVADPAKPRLLAHRVWHPPLGSTTHSPLQFPDRNLLIVSDEPAQDNCADGIKRIWVFDVYEPSNPVSIATMPLPDEQRYCELPGKFGPHNLHENRPGALQNSNLVFATYCNAGLRVFDITDPFQPRDAGHFVPPPPTLRMDPRPNRPLVIQSGDVFAAADGLLYMTDFNAGLYILDYEGRS